MDARRYILLAASLFLLMMSTSCSLIEDAGEPDHFAGVIATSPTCIQLAFVSGCEVATVVRSELELPAVLESWGYEAGEVEFTGLPLVFVGAIDSGTCPVQIAGAKVENSVFAVQTSRFGAEECTADARSRSFIIQAESGATIDAVTISGRELRMFGP